MASICSRANFSIGLTYRAIFDENAKLKERLQKARRAPEEAHQTYGKYYNHGKKVEFQPSEGNLMWNIGIAWEVFLRSQENGAALPCPEAPGTSLL